MKITAIPEGVSPWTAITDSPLNEADFAGGSTEPLEVSSLSQSFTESVSPSTLLQVESPPSSDRATKSTRSDQRLWSCELTPKALDNGALTAPQIRDGIKRLMRVRASDLLRNPKNWRIHGKAQRAACSGLLTEIGYADALLVRELPDGRLMIIDGHMRAETTPDALAPVLILDVTEEEADKLLLTLDPLAAMAESNSSLVQRLLETVRTDNPAVEDLFSRAVVSRVWQIVHPDEVREADVSPERADELRGKWKTEMGQLWQIGEHRVIGGDSTDPRVVDRLWADDGPLVRAIGTDCPYGVRYGEKTHYSKRHGHGRRPRPIENDSLAPAELKKLFAQALNVCRAHAVPGCVVYAAVPSVFIEHFIQAFGDGGFTYHHCLIWVKQQFVLGRSDYHYRDEPILYGWLESGPHYFIDDRTHSSVFEIDRPHSSPDHPTCKPVELIARMIANSNRPGELVYDPFCGSGSTIVAPRQLGRIGYGCEIDPGYLAVELERLSLLGLNPEIKGQS